MSQISVIIPNYNGMKYLPGCLEALQTQENGTVDFEIIVVDNGSTDGSVSYLEQVPSVRKILLEENTGFCHAVNVGIEASDALYVILLNNDTKVRKGFVKNLYQAIQKEEDIFSVSAKMLMWDNEGLVDDAGDRYCALGWAYARGKGRQSLLYEDVVEVFSSCGGAAIYRKKILDRIGLFDENHFAYLEDLDIGYRAKIYGYRNMYEPKAEVVHYGSASSGSRYNEWKTKLASTNSVYVIGKNMPLLQWVWNLPFFLVGFFLKYLFFCKRKMGMLYLRGLFRGLGKCCSREARLHKIPFKLKNIWNYFKIQWQLYVNIFYYLLKK